MSGSGNPMRPLLVGLFISIVINLIFIVKYYQSKVEIVPLDNSKWELRVDSLEGSIKKKDSAIAALKVGIEAKAETVFVNRKKVENDVINISKYSDIKRLYDSLYSAR